MRPYVFAYRLGLSLYFTAVRIAALYQPKARLFVDGRKNLLPAMRARMAGDPRSRILVHCASLGEFEQGRPIIEALRAAYPGVAIVVTFFSPSGYEVRKDYSGADYVFYLPIDSPHNATDFLDVVQPSLCIFIKYEFWYYYLTAIAQRKIPLLLVSAVFTRRHPFFKWYGGLQRKMLHCFNHIFVQDGTSLQLLQSIGIDNCSVSGDTRFDRVIGIAQNAGALPVAEAFGKGHKVLVAGSTWRDDEQFLARVLPKLPGEWRLLLVPHEVDAAHIAGIERLFAGNTVRWSAWKADEGKRVLVVDGVGLLSRLYRYGHVAWIGGGFGKEGIHNVLEAAVYGVPCIFGPVFHQFIEARELVARGGAITVSAPDALLKEIEGLTDPGRQEQIATIAREYVYSGGGATWRVMDYISKLGWRKKQ